MPWAILLSLIPEVVRGAIAIAREHYALKKAEAEARKAEAERKKEENDVSRS
jgi:hypothetical protein